MASRPATVVYLICFHKPWPAGKHPRHYCGSASDLAERVASHRRATGSSYHGKLVALMNAAGIGWDVARVWPGEHDQVPAGFDFAAWEKRLKSWGHLRDLCPECNPAGWQKNGVIRPRRMNTA